MVTARGSAMAAHRCVLHYRTKFTHGAPAARWFHHFG
jgi:hypothetical protein